MSASESDCSSRKEVDVGISEFLSSLDSGSGSEDCTDGTFYFETDYLPLKGNPDYLKLMRSLAILEIQRIKTSQDIEKIESLRVRVKEDPGSVLKDILSGNVSFNSRGKIERVPEINWSKYKSLNFDGKLPTMTRRMAKMLTEDPPPEEVSESTPGTSSSVDLMVRGRKFNQNKPETFNQLWTVEEQLRLETLLVEYPPEPVEWRRWEKISNALGNRTPKQVCSRVQKYFRKLRQVGVAVPGKVRSAINSKPRLVHRRNKHLLYRPTTFFPGVAMGEMCDDSDDGEEESTRPGGGCGSGLSCSTSLPSGGQLDLSHWVDILDRIKLEKSKTTEPGHSPVLHYGYKCNCCGEEPLRGVRWECKNCEEALSSCCDCLMSLVSSTEPWHPPGHVFAPSRLYTNPQYSTKAFSTHNYLDPNFIA